MISKLQQARELEAELLRLNNLVRERREQLARLEECPNSQCPCRAVWREKVDRGLASQVRKISKQVGGGNNFDVPKFEVPKLRPRKVSAPRAT